MPPKPGLMARSPEVAEWIRSRPQAVRDLMVRFPPFCRVRGLRPLLAPAPGTVGEVCSWFEDGNVRVACEETQIAGECDPSWIEVVDYAPGFSPEDVRAVIEDPAPLKF